MKNLLALIALVVLFSASVFAAGVVNNFTTEVTCPTVSINTGTINSFDLGYLQADGTLDGVGPQSATWNVDNWGKDGTFWIQEATTWTAPTGGDPTDVSVVESWTTGGLTPATSLTTATSVPNNIWYTYASQLCNAEATFALTISSAKAKLTSVKGQYKLTVSLTVNYN
jgi:hypothetical protein